MQEGGVVFYCQVFDFEFCDTWKQGHNLDVLFYSRGNLFNLYQFIFFSCWGLYKDLFQFDSIF